SSKAISHQLSVISHQLSASRFPPTCLPVVSSWFLGQGNLLTIGYWLLATDYSLGFGQGLGLADHADVVGTHLALALPAGPQPLRPEDHQQDQGQREQEQTKRLEIG